MAKHVVEAEELQAYLDRELAAGRAAEVARHLAECRECAGLLADLKRVSETLQRWQVEPAPARLRPPVIETTRPERLWVWRRWVLALAGTAAVVLLVVAVSIPNLLKSRMEREKVTSLSTPGAEAPAEKMREPGKLAPPPPPASPSTPAERDRRAKLAAQEESKDKFKAAPGKEGSGEVGGVVGGVPGAVGMLKDESGRMADEAAPAANAQRAAQVAAKSAAVPRMIAYQVAMTIEVKEFEPAKAKLLKIADQAGGYLSQASTAETPNQPRRADVVVRVPVAQLSAVLEQLRGLGRVTQEQLASEEVTGQVVDLEARLRNARATEQRLIAVLNERTGKVRDILEVEREIASTREQIERMEAQRQNLLHRVELATVEVALVEEFQAQLAPAPVGTGTRLRNAFVEGYENLVGLLLGFAFFFARYGLVLAFWTVLVWLTWRVVRRSLLRGVGARQ